jgi:hypothetical protein
MEPRGTTSVPFVVPKGTKVTPGILVHRVFRAFKVNRASKVRLDRKETKGTPVQRVVRENLVLKASKENLVRREIKEIPENQDLKASKASPDRQVPKVIKAMQVTLVP